MSFVSIVSIQWQLLSYGTWPDVREVPTMHAKLTSSWWARNLEASASIRPRCLTPDVRPVGRSMFNGFLDRAKTQKWTTTAALIAAMSGTCRKTVPTIHHATSPPCPKSPKSRSSGPRYRCSSERLAVLFDGVKALSADGCAAGSRGESAHTKRR